MVDYYSILARAVRDLDPNTPAARRRLYLRARSALTSEMHNADPPIPRSEIMVEHISLEVAIEEVEADAGPEPLQVATEEFEESGRKPVPTARPLPSRLSMAPRQPANQNVDKRGSCSGIWTLFRWRSTDSIEVGEQGIVEHHDTWLTEVLERASDEEDEEFQDFAPRWARSRSR